METIPGNLYDYPRYYDLVYGSDWKAEVDFLSSCFTKHASGNVTRVFEPACGTGRLIFRLAKEGYDVSGLDLNRHAIRYCNARLRRHGFDDATFVGDMTDFKLPRKVDAAFNTINSFRHLASEAAAVDHLNCMASALRKGGLYILGLHLTPTRGEASEEEHWSAQRGQLCVNTSMELTRRDLKQREELYAISYQVYTPTRSFRIQDEFVFRTYTAKQMETLLAKIDGLTIAATYDFAYRIDDPITVTPTTEDVVYVLQKQ